MLSYLCSNSPADIHQCGIHKFPFHLLDIRVVQSSSYKPFQRPDSVSEIGRFLCLCGFSDGSLLWAERNERTA
jgi:hypothetical protein